MSLDDERTRSTLWNGSKLSIMLEGLEKTVCYDGCPDDHLRWLGAIILWA